MWGKSQATIPVIFIKGDPGAHHPVVGRFLSEKRQTGFLGKELVGHPSSVLLWLRGFSAKPQENKEDLVKQAGAIGWAGAIDK